MTLKETLQAFLDELDWEDEIGEHEGEHFIDTGYKVEAQRCRLQFITNEATQLIRVSLRSPISVPDDRRVVGAVVLNALNLRLPVGALHMDEDGVIYFAWAIDVEGSGASTKQFVNMVAAAGSAFDRVRTAAIGAAAYTQFSAKRILAEYHAALDEMMEAERAAESDET